MKCYTIKHDAILMQCYSLITFVFKLSNICFTPKEELLLYVSLMVFEPPFIALQHGTRTMSTVY